MVGSPGKAASSDSPIENAFRRVAPSDRFNFFAIFPAAVLMRAIDFSSRTSVAVQARLFFDFLAMGKPLPIGN